jgi:serine/threonine protein kinase
MDRIPAQDSGDDRGDSGMSTSPRRLGKYELQQRLGWGGMAEVWKAFDSQLQRYVAIKLLHMNLQADPDFVMRFQREAQLIASLHHPNIVQIHDFQIAGPLETDSPIAYMVMDYIEGPTLAEHIRTTSAWRLIPSPHEIVNFFTSISLAVDYAHQKGMIHRDIKPANILLDKRNTHFNSIGEPILTDFGVAKLLGISASATSGSQLGTPLYISPEQARGLPGDARSDLYSLGVMLYEMVTGVTPFQGDTPVAVITQHINTMPPSPALINPRIPPALITVISQALAKDPNDRFPNATAMTIAIAHALNIPVPERLGSPTDRLSPESTGTRDHAPTNPQQSSGRTPTMNQGSTGGTTFADSSQSQPNVTPAISTWGTPGQGQPPSSQSGSQWASQTRGGFAQSTPNVVSQSAMSGQAPPLPALPQATQPPAPDGSQARRLRWWYIALAALLLIVLISAGSGAFLLFRTGVINHAPTVSQVVGHAFYVSSGQIVQDAIGADGARGIADKLQVDMQNVQPPPAGKSYYLWLLSDIDQTPKKDLLPPPTIHPPILLTNNLPVQSDGIVQYTYQGDAQHNNLLSATSRLLITLEDAGRTPSSPSTDRSTWVYYAQLPQMYIPNDPTGLRGLDHIRHLYYNEDHLPVKARYGGLDVWVFRDTEKLLELSTSARDDFNGTTANYGQMHDLFNKILDYLDGTPNVHLDVPPGTPPTADTSIADISLLTVDPTRQGVAQYLQTDPPGDLDHLLLHLNQLNRAPDATADIHQHASEIVVAITNAKDWLTCARADAKQLFYMTMNQPSPGAAVCQVAPNRAACPTQPAQNLSVCLLPKTAPVCANQPAQDITCLLDDLVTQVTYAYIGQLDPNTDIITPGVLQAHYDVQLLPTFEITKNVPKSL